MKKLLFVFLFISSIWAGNIKTDNTIFGIEGGSFKLSDNSSTDRCIGVKLGYYFYEQNPYLLSNRLYFTGSRILKNDASLYMGEINLDWLFNNLDYLKPFVGVNVDYLYDNDTNSNSTAAYGFNAGIIIYLGSFIELEGGAKTYRPLSNSNLYPNNFKKIYGSINFSF